MDPEMERLSINYVDHPNKDDVIRKIIERLRKLSKAYASDFQ
ncbi:MAG: hypothetical protein ACTSXC_03565 [Candidatus Freyarchaeota archaeon]